MESDATRRMRFFKVSKKPFMEMKPDSIFSNINQLGSGQNSEKEISSV